MRRVIRIFKYFKDNHWILMDCSVKLHYVQTNFPLNLTQKVNSLVPDMICELAHLH